MSLDTIIMLAGAFVAALPFLGFPSSWDTVLFFLAGVLVIALGITVRRRRVSSRARELSRRNPDMFSQHVDTHEPL